MGITLSLIINRMAGQCESDYKYLASVPHIKRYFREMKFLILFGTVVSAGGRVDSSSAAITPTPTSERPGWIRRISQDLTQIVIMGRSSGVPYETAASIANEFVEGALRPPQITSLAQDVFSLLVNELPFADVGSWPDPTSVKQLADDSNKVYNELHEKNAYKSYMSYVSANAHIIDGAKVKSMLSTPPDVITDPVISSWHVSELSKTKELEHSFATNSAGSQALETFSTLGSKLLSDVGSGGDFRQFKDLIVNLFNNIA